MESFNGFYLPQGKLASSSEDRNKRSVLDSFTSFYLNKATQPNAENRNKRDVDLETRNGLDSFTSFYLPRGVNVDQGPIL